MKKYLGAAFFISTMSIAACSQAGAADMDRKQVEEIVKEYLLENPEIIRDAMIALEAKEEMAALDAVKTRVFNDSRDPTVGPKNAKVTIVEFFDYNCGFCKKSTDWLAEVIEGNPDDVRVIFKELPILDGRSKTSRTAARAALAAAEQGKYWDMHVALMEQRGLTDEKIENLAKDVGLDITKFKKDMNNKAHTLHLDDNMRIAQELPMFSGTPFFMIGDEYVAGANTDYLQAMLDTALEK